MNNNYSKLFLFRDLCECINLLLTTEGVMTITYQNSPQTIKMSISEFLSTKDYCLWGSIAKEEHKISRSNEKMWKIFFDKDQPFGKHSSISKKKEHSWRQHYLIASQAEYRYQQGSMVHWSAKSIYNSVFFIYSWFELEKNKKLVPFHIERAINSANQICNLCSRFVCVNQDKNITFFFDSCLEENNLHGYREHGYKRCNQEICERTLEIDGYYPYVDIWVGCTWMVPMVAVVLNDTFNLLEPRNGLDPRRGSFLKYQKLCQLVGVISIVLGTFEIFSSDSKANRIFIASGSLSLLKGLIPSRFRLICHDVITKNNDKTELLSMAEVVLIACVFFSIMVGTFGHRDFMGNFTKSDPVLITAGGMLLTQNLIPRKYFVKVCSEVSSRKDSLCLRINRIARKCFVCVKALWRN